MELHLKGMFEMKNIKSVLFLLIFQLLVLPRAHSGEWKQFYSLNTPRAGASSVVLDGKIYVLGGKTINNKVLNTVECFDPGQGMWIENALPPFETERYNAAAVVFNGKIFLIGGRSSKEILEDVEVFDPVQNSWKHVQNIHEGREGHVAFIMNERIYIIGGQENEYELIKKIEWYDEANDEWEEEKEKCPFPRVAAFGAGLNNIFYMFGGYYYGMNNEGYKWDKNAMHKSWESLPSLSEARAYGATVVKGDSLFLIGGETATGKSGTVEIFNTKTEALSSGTPLPAPRSGLTGVCLNDTIYVIGGYDNNTENPLNSVEIFVETTTGLENNSNYSLPRSKILINGYPNPFNGQISLEVELPKLASYRLDIYNLRGQHVKSLFNGLAAGGKKYFKWYGNDEHGKAVSSGVYWLVVRSSDVRASFKIIYVR